MDVAFTGPVSGNAKQRNDPCSPAHEFFIFRIALLVGVVSRTRPCNELRTRCAVSIHHGTSQRTARRAADVCLAPLVSGLYQHNSFMGINAHSRPAIGRFNHVDPRRHRLHHRCARHVCRLAERIRKARVATGGEIT